MNPYRVLLRNVLTFTVGTAGVQLISLAMLPFYTRNMSTAEYGVVDIALLVLALVAPIASLSIYEGLLRFVIGNEAEHASVLRTSAAVTMLGAAVCVVLVYSLELAGAVDLPPFFAAVLIAQMVQALVAQFSRARGHVRLYATVGVVMAGTHAATSAYLIGSRGFGVSGFMLGLLVSSVVATAVNVLAERRALCEPGSVDIDLARRLLTFSIPLIPNAASWWVVNGFSRLVLIAVEGAGAVGLYAVAARVPSLLSILSTVFGRAWQQSAYEEYNSQSRSRFYSNVFNFLFALWVLLTSAVLVVLKAVLPALVGGAFAEAWRYVPLLLLAAMFQSFASFYGTNYSAAMRTLGALTSSMIAAAASAASALILVPRFGTTGAALSVAVGFFALWTVRIVDTRRYIRVDFPWWRAGVCAGVLGAQTLSLYMDLGRATEILVGALAFAGLLVVNVGILLPGMRRLRSRS